MPQEFLIVEGAAEHNLKDIDVRIPRNSLTVITGPSGSGKSSLAFDTIYAEGQRRYIESLSSYARQFLDQLQKPRVKRIVGLSPAISIEQKSVSQNPRSTVGTVTEIYDYLRVLYASIGHPHCPECGRAIERQSIQHIADQILRFPQGTRLAVMAPVVRGRKGEYTQLFEQAVKEGFTRARIDGEMLELDDEAPRLRKNYKHTIEIVVDRLILRDDMRLRLVDALELAAKKAEGLVSIFCYDGLPKAAAQSLKKKRGRKKESGEKNVLTFSEHFACHECELSFEEIVPRTFSFNSPYGACPRCNGLGTQQELDENLVVADRDLSVREGAVRPWSNFFRNAEDRGGWDNANWNYRVISATAKHFGIDLDAPWKKLPRRHQDILLHGSGSEAIHIYIESKRGAKYENNMPFEGVITNLQRRLKQTTSQAVRDWIVSYYGSRPCPDCGGQRLNPQARAVTIGDQNITEFCRKSVSEAIAFFASLKLVKEEDYIAQQPVKEVLERLSFMENVGLNYLTLDRLANSLAGGEAQRIRLATQIGSQLVGVLYVLDEPSIGLHQRDNQRLIETLTALRDRGNTVLVVEHDKATMDAADYILDLGPGGGRLGGEVVAAGPPAAIRACEKSLTGRYLTGRESIPVPARRRPGQDRALVVRGAAQHTLKSIDVTFPLGLFTCVTGVSGSGKSTLVNEILYAGLARRFYKSKRRPGLHKGIDGAEFIDKVIEVNQAPIGRTPRSNPATYVQLFGPIRELYAKLPEAKMRGYKAGRFSFNVKGGRCESCEGDGVKKIEMHFLADVYVTCDACRGRRYNRETLEVTYRGKNIADVLEMTVEEALEFFSRVPPIRGKLQTLFDVGLDYIHLGQPATTLSGGEAQRIKLSKELSKRQTGRTLYILDEPTTGLHFDDIKKLLGVLDRLVDAGNTAIVIEHNLDVIKCADWIVDLGPEGGEAGGRVVATGTPEAVAKRQRSITGQFLKHVLNGNDTPMSKKRGKGRKKK